MVEWERVTVWTFSGEQLVSSFRVAALSSQYLQLMEQIVSSELTQTPWTVAGKRAGRPLHEGGREVGSGEEVDVGGTQDTAALSKKEARRIRRERRKKEWAELFQLRPDEKYEDPKESQAVEQFRENMGDYKLKTSGDYVVPPDQRVSTDKKRRQLVLLRKQIFDCKQQYNQKLLALRDRKVAIVEKISSLINQLSSLQTELPSSLRKPLPDIPTIRDEEVPERRREYTRETLLQFGKETEARELAERQAAAGVGDGFGGFGGFGGGGENEGEKPSEEATDGKEEAKEEGRDEEDGAEEGGSGPPSTSQLDQQLSPMQALQRQEQQVHLLYGQDCLLQEITELKASFDHNLLRLRHEKADMDISILAADLKHITQFEELQLLKEFEKRETTFTSRYRTKKQEREEMANKMEEAQWSLTEKERQLGKLQEQDKALHASFSEAIGENNKFRDFLMKVFTKKIKRAKKKPMERTEEGEGEEEMSDEESDSDSLSSSEEESDSEEGVDDTVCPTGCDHTLFDQAVALREQRLDLEEAVMEEKKALDTQRKELEALKKKTKSMDSHVKTALADLQAFQLKKQQRLNELDQVAVLRLHQILVFRAGGERPASIAPCLVFPASSLLGLTQRIGELAVEKQQEKKRYRELRQRHVRLGREKKEMQHQVSELEAKVKEMMILKFGRVVDLEKLEGLSTNRIAEELQAKLKQLEQTQRGELVTLEGQIDRERQKLLKVTRENTQRLDRKYSFINAQRSLEHRLNNRQKNMSTEVGGAQSRSHDHSERQQLLQLVRLQAQESEALKEEIRLLSHKGGRILPPSQPPVGTEPQPSLQ